MSEVFGASDGGQRIAAVVLAGQKVLIAGTGGGLVVLSAVDGKVIARRDLPACIWDGLAVAAGRLFASTADGKLICLAARGEADGQ
jgi:outer membrane protein assembly factor BamB